MTYSNVPDAPLEVMRSNAARELADWQRAEADARKRLTGASALVAYWSQELGQVETESKARK